MRKAQFQSLVIHTFEADRFHLPRHSHTYYELVYIFKGSGDHYLNNIVMPYQSGDLFLLSPGDEHYFEIKKTTKFSFIKFNDSYLSSNKKLSPDILVNASPIEVMKNPSLKEVKLIFTEPCKTILRKTIENINDYDQLHEVSNSPIVFFQVLAIFGLIQEASAKLNIYTHPSVPGEEDLLSYIHENIYDPEKIRVQAIASHFKIANNYFSNYFKRNFDRSYREYVSEYKLKLIEKRIQGGQMTMKQIAYEFGFTDESHLTHFFKKQKNISPSKFKSVQLS